MLGAVILIPVGSPPVWDHVPVPSAKSVAPKNILDSSHNSWSGPAIASEGGGPVNVNVTVSDCGAHKDGTTKGSVGLGGSDGGGLLDIVHVKT